MCSKIYLILQKIPLFSYKTVNPLLSSIGNKLINFLFRPSHALASIKKKLTNSNPHIVLYALLVLESCVKNCGNLIHDEVGTKAFMEQMKELVRGTQHEEVKAKILELIQAWAHAFRNSPKYRAVPVSRIFFSFLSRDLIEGTVSTEVFLFRN